MYTAVDRHNLIKTDNLYTSSIFDQIEAFGIPEMANKSFTNLGFGVIRNLNKKLDLYLGFNTDYNNYDASQFDKYKDFVPSVTNWNLYQYSTGLNYKMKYFIFTYGLFYIRRTIHNEQQLVNLTKPNEDYCYLESPPIQ